MNTCIQLLYHIMKFKSDIKDIDNVSKSSISILNTDLWSFQVIKDWWKKNLSWFPQKNYCFPFWHHVL